MEKIKFEPIWFESLGAKSSCILVKTSDISLIIDPGIASMQQSFPASAREKLYWKMAGKRAIEKASEKADMGVISHYHYDHHSVDDWDVYRNKLLFAKNPNEYINDSQRCRAEYFFTELYKKFGKRSLEKLPPQSKDYPDIFDELEIAKSRDFGSYNQRRMEVLERGRKWFLDRAKKWKSYPVIPEFRLKNLEVRFPEGKEYKFGETKLRFTKPLFHGLEYSRVGWVFATVVEYEGEKLIHSSDVDGPVIEDYTEWLIRENPKVLILDGPSTYMFGYMIIKRNLDRVVENMCKMIEEIALELLIYDHHLLRDVKYKQRLKKVYETAMEYNKKVITAAEYLEKKPIVEQLV